MSQPQRTKHPLAVLQSMINGILIETGKALRAADKEGGRTVANANTRLRSTIPSAVDNFHQALDELEGDIIQAKACLLRELEELTANRIAAENPPIEAVDDMPKPESNILGDLPPELEETMESKLPTPPFAIKEEDIESENPAQPLQTEDKPPLPLMSDIPKDNVTMPAETGKGVQSPEPSAIDVNAKTSSVVPGTDDQAASADLVTAEFQDSSIDPSIDALFGISDSNNENTTSDLTFDIDFPMLDANQTQEHSQKQSNDFNLSTFRDVSQDFSMIDMQPVNDTNSGNDTLNTISNTQLNLTDNSYNVGDGSAVEDGMDLELDLGMVGAEDSAFDSMFFDGADDGGMVHAFDNAFFGIPD